jgi:uncharacterized repeat protein (TIGR03803 family)
MMRPILPTILLFAALFGPVASTEAQTYEKLHSFTGTPDGAAPIASLIQATGGLFYGTTRDGGANSCGTVFTTDGSSVPTILHSFTDAEGCHPAAALLQANDGLFYGMAGDGGAYGGGTLFRMNSIGEVTVLHDFGDPLVDHDGTLPYYGLIQASDGFFYGTTVYGGAFGWGSVFRTRGTAEYEVLHSFGASTFEAGPVFGALFSPGYIPPSVGASPSSPLLQASDGTFFGMTAFGGNPNGDSTPADDPYFRVPGGTIFQLTPPTGTNSQWNVSYRFNFMVGGGNGDTPFGGLIQTSPTTFYGTTSSFAGVFSTADAEWAGTIFQLDTSADLGGLYTVYQFSGPPSFPDGAVPFGALMLAGDGNLYGTASAAGPLGDGVVFRMDAAGQVTLLHAFDHHATDGDAGAQPNAALIQGIDGNIYGTTAGTTPFGLGNSPGTLFRLIIRQDQTITFGALANKTIGDADFLVTATASSSLKVTFAPSGNCTMSGDTVHLTGAGDCTVTASQAGDAYYNPAPSVPRSFTVAKLTATLALSNLSQSFDGNPKSVTVTTSPAGLSGVSITYNGSTIAPTASGSYAVVASLTNDTYQATNATGTLVISIPAATLSLSPVSVTGGTTSTATVTLASPAPNGGAVVSLASSAPGAATVPATVLIMKGKTTKTFTVTTFAVATVTPVNISASYAGTTATSPLTVNPAALSALTLNPLGVKGGVSSTAKVTLNGPAPAGGLLVTLTSSKPSVAASTSVTVPAGSSSATVPITTFAVTANTTVNITATGGGVSKSSTLTVKK